MICSNCGQELTETSFGGFYLYVCDDWRCSLYRERQGIRAKEPEKKKCPRKKDQPGYGQWLWQKKDNYHELRRHKIPSKEAANVCGNYKRTREILERV